MQMIELKRPVAASFLAAMGISNEPGTRRISICFSPAPARSSASSAPARRRSVMKALNRLEMSAHHSASLKLCRPLFEERASALAHIIGRAAQTEERGFEEHTLFLR